MGCVIARVLATSLLATAAYAQSPAPFELPAPTGRFPIGTTQWAVRDSSRDEVFAPGRKRDVEVIAWYPRASSRPAAEKTDTTAPYLRDGLEEVRSFSRLAKLGDTFDGLARVKTHAVVDAPPTTTLARLPVIIFQHGYTGLPSSHTALMEDLASRGWAVLHVIHPYEATGAKLADGVVVTFTDDANGLRKPIIDVLNEWAAEGPTMDQITEAPDDEQRDKLMRTYLGTLKNTDQVVLRWTADVKYVLDHLPKVGVAGRVAAKLDLNRLGAAGHSMGGVASAAFCLDDRRCKAVLNLDGIPQYGTMIDRKLPAPLLMVYSARPGRVGASDIIYQRSASKYYRVDVKDTLHLDFCDVNFWGGPLRERGAFGKIDPVRAAEITRTIVREFFAQELLKQPSPLLSGKQPMAEVTVAGPKK